jgi:hypothetical protein
MSKIPCIYVLRLNSDSEQSRRRIVLFFKVAGSISVGVSGVFHRLNTSDRAVALGSTQLLIQISARSISWEAKAAGA